MKRAKHLLGKKKREELSYCKNLKNLCVAVDRIERFEELYYELDTKPTLIQKTPESTFPLFVDEDWKLEGVNYFNSREIFFRRSESGAMAQRKI